MNRNINIEEFIKDKNINKLTNEKLAIKYNLGSEKSVRRFINKLMNDGYKIITKKPILNKPSKAKTDEDIINLLKQKAYTEKETIKKFNKTFNDIKKISKDKYEIYIQRNNYNEKILTIFDTVKEQVKIKDKIWKYKIQKDGDPYLWISFPDNLKTDKIRILPISDSHIGHVSSDMKQLINDIEFIRQNDNVFCFLSGDILENSNKLSIAGSVYEQKDIPQVQIDYTFELLAPIAHKILWIIPGNHENRTYNYHGIDISKILADKLKIPYFNEPVYVDIMWKDYVWSFYNQHGVTSSQTKGGKLNAAGKALTFTEFTNFYIMGHVHDKLSNESTRIVRDRSNFKLILQKQYVIILSSYLKYFQTYGSKAAYSPNTKGNTTIKLYSNGDYFLGD